MMLNYIVISPIAILPDLDNILRLSLVRNVETTLGERERETERQRYERHQQPILTK